LKQIRESSVANPSIGMQPPEKYT